MRYYDKKTGIIYSDDDKIYIPDTTYEDLYAAHKTELDLGDGELRYSEIQNKLIYAPIYKYAVIHDNDAFTIESARTKPEDLELTGEQARVIKDEMSNGYLHYVSNGIIYKIKPENDELFDWETKTIKKIANINVLSKRSDLLATDLITKMTEVGVRYVHEDFGDLYYPITAENLVLLQLLKSSTPENRTITLYTLRDNYLNPDSVKIFTGNLVTEAMLQTLIDKAIKYKALLSSVVYAYKVELSNETDTVSMTRLVEQYAKIIIDRIEEGL